ncbi:MAG: outer membrane protein OmpA-like peptidoglycan-associated protein [Glaciecola sp.]|jgi:outer membrane protein OmpA-like peptidoglycan-associated protein
MQDNEVQDNEDSQKDEGKLNEENIQLEALRQILVGHKVEESVSELRAESRKMVSEVLSEALHDREQQDGSVQRIIQPIVAKSVEKSISNQREEFIDYLYPLMGSLVRKSVAVFFTDFIEKTNDIIENSFTAKGIKWRISAWRAGVSFSEYVASQTFVFKVEQVFLIHKETGNLLKSVVSDNFKEEDADLVSAMLTAINDFVADSFNPSNEGNEQHLDTIKTDDFTLLIRQSPHAILVAAVTGNISREANIQLQVTLEEIQRIFLDDLKSFDGDSKAFLTADSLLRDCLLSETINENEKSAKKPIFGLIVFFILLGAIGWYIFGWIYTNYTISEIERLPSTPGLVVQKLSVSERYHIQLKVMRDPDAMSTEDWLAQSDIDPAYVKVIETPFISIDSALLKHKIEKIVSQYESVDFDTPSMAFTGSIELNEYQNLVGQLNQVPGIELLNIDSQALEIIDNAFDLSENTAVNEQLFIRLVGEISSIQIGFDPGETSLSPNQNTGLDKVTENYINIERLAKKLNRSANLVIVGASDSSGERSFNQRLSRQRALVVREALIERGLKPEHIFSVGIGEIELPGNIKTTRKVLFNVMFAELNGRVVE